MKEDHEGDMVPRQKKGAETNAEESVTAFSLEEAKLIFMKAKERLLDIDHWHRWSGFGSATFHVTDEKGRRLERSAREGDLVCIDIPGPGNSEGDGKDWVRVEAIESSYDAANDYEVFSLVVRPTSNPKSSSGETAHFYSSDATSTYMVQREGRKVWAAEHGRNETPNTDVDKALDKARNAAVALGGMAGLSKLQWKALVKGLLEK
jgi:hypothetical protein